MTAWLLYHSPTVEIPGSDKAVRWARVLFCLLPCVSIILLLDPVGAYAHEGDGTVVVHVTDAGFEPRSVEVGPGDTVAFENAGDKAHWPASDDHPMHTSYPGFDPKKPVAPGEEWSFTFGKPGKWAYHDHMNPYLEGEVVVRDEKPESDGLLSSVSSFFSNLYGSVLSAFVGDKEEPTSSGQGGEGTKGSSSTAGRSEEPVGERYGEVKDELIALVRDENPKVALDRLWAETETDAALLDSCHPLVHEIGRAAYEKYGDFGEAMKYQDEGCEAGYFHGVIETRLSKSDDVFADMETMCDPYPWGSFVSWQCYHGLGHGVMYFTANDLPRSLEMCDVFREASTQFACTNGVFMENFSADQKLHLSAYLKEDDPFYPCMEQAKRHKQNCYRYAPYYWLNVNDNDYVGALEWCEGAEAGFGATCAKGVGAQTMRRHISDPKFVESTCAKGKAGQTAPCIEGMVSMYISHHSSLGPARTLCEQLEAPNRPACRAEIASQSSVFET